jgi:hypothetical protein
MSVSTSPSISYALTLRSQLLRRMTDPNVILGGTSSILTRIATARNHYLDVQRLGPVVTQRALATPVDTSPSKSNIQLLPGTISHKLPEDDLPPLEKYLFDRIRAVAKSALLPRIHAEYKSNAGRVLDAYLTYESRPNAIRKIEPLSTMSGSDDDGVVLIAYLGVAKTGKCWVSLSSGFALALDGRENNDQEQCVATCCHTLEEVRFLKYLCTC